MNKFLGWFLCAMAVILPFVFVVAGYALSWIITCGLVKLVTLCFGWSFSWPIATGIWIVLCILKTMFGRK